MADLGSLAGRMARVDARITRAIGEDAIIKGTPTPGIFTNSYREVETPDGAVVGLQISFDCRYSEAVSRLQDNELIEIPGRGKYRFLQRLPDEGTDSGWVVLELGSRV